LTSPSGRKYITHVVKLGTSSVGAGIRGVGKRKYLSYGLHGLENGHGNLVLDEIDDGTVSFANPGNAPCHSASASSPGMRKPD